MNKPSSYDSVQASGDYTQVALGGHTCVIKSVKEMQSKTGKDMIVVYFDFDSADQQANYFMEENKFSDNPEKKWPFKGTMYIMVNDYKDPNKVSKNFKTFCSCVEKSNTGFAVTWGNDWGKQFQNKRIGAVYRNEEYEYNGQTYTSPKCCWFCQYDKAAGAAIPETKYLKKKQDTLDDVAQRITILDDDTDLPF